MYDWKQKAIKKVTVETVGLIFRSSNLKIKSEDKAWLSLIILDCLV